MVLPLYFNTNCGYTSEVSVYKLCLLEKGKSLPPEGSLQQFPPKDNFR